MMTATAATIAELIPFSEIEHDSCVVNGSGKGESIACWRLGLVLDWTWERVQENRCYGKRIWLL
eukprot:4109631-Amphidinium_carterae.1